MAGIKPYTNNYNELVDFLIGSLSKELKEQYPQTVVTRDLSDTLARAAEQIGNKFFIVIDEWDAPIRENPAVQNSYLEFLRSLFKNSGTTPKIFAAAYGNTESAAGKRADYEMLGVQTISMKNDFLTIYGDGVEKDENAGSFCLLTPLYNSATLM